MKRKRRYLLLKLERPRPFAEEEARALGEEAILESLGEKGASVAQARLRLFNEKEQQALVYCSLGSTESVIAAFALKRYFRREDVAVRLQKIFGTLKKALPLFPEARPPSKKQAGRLEPYPFLPESKK